MINDKDTVIKYHDLLARTCVEDKKLKYLTFPAQIIPALWIAMWSNTGPTENLFPKFDLILIWP